MRLVMSFFPIVFFLFILNYFVMPVYSLSFPGIYIAATVVLAFAALNLRGGEIYAMTIGICGPALLIMAMFLSSSPLLHANRYRSLIGVVHEKDFSKALPPIDIHNAPLVSEHMARQAAQKKLSDIPALGSQVVLSTFTKQNIKGKLYWVSFLEHSGFFQWNNTSHTPGYIKVSVTNSDDVEFIQTVKGKPLKMRFLNSAYFGDNADRVIYSQNKTFGISEPSNEVDDEGNPYLVSTLYDHTIGFAGADAVGVAVLDVQTGLVQNYSIANLPKWIDRVQPEDIIETQVEDWGEYVHGWFNPSKKDRMTISDHIDFVYGEDGSCYYYIGISSVGKDNGIIGFMMMNSRNKDTTLYFLSGAAENVAAQTVVDVMPEKNYHSTNPIPFSVEGVPTYIMALTDQNGIPRGYGMVDIQHYTIVAVSDTLKSTYQLYLNRLARKSSDPANIDEYKDASVTQIGTIERVGSEIRNGTTIYYLTIKESSKIFSATSDLSEKLVLTKPGDTVQIVHEKNEQKVITMSKFDNGSVK